MGYVIEFQGLPGGGKSTYARALAEKGVGTIVRVSGKKEIIWYNLIELFHRPIQSLRIFAFILAHLGGPGMRYEKLVNLFLVHQAKYAKARGCSVAIIDQGHYQSVISLFDEREQKKGIQHLCSILPRPDLLIVVHPKRSVREAHLLKRGYDVRQGQDEKVRLQWKEVAEENQQTFLSLLPSLGISSEIISTDEAGERFVNRQTQTPFSYILNARIPTERAYGGQVATMCSEFSKLGLNVEIVAPKRHNPITMDVFSYYGVPENFRMRYLSAADVTWMKIFPSAGLFYANALLYLTSLLSLRLRPNTVVFTRKPEIAWLFRLRGYKVFYECHDWFKRGRSIQLWLLRNVNEIITTNSYIQDAFLSHGFSPLHVHVLPNGVDLSVFSLEYEKKTAQEAHGLPERILDIGSKCVLLYTGSFRTMGEEKGVGETLRAMQHLPQDIIFLAVGGSEGDITYYKKLASDFGVSERAFFFGRVGKKELALFQRAADILVMPFPKRAHFEFHMSPLKTFEYMASGRPIVATNLPSIRAILDDTCAYFVSPEDPSALAQCIVYVREHADEALQKASQARKLVEKYRWDKRASTIIGLIG